MNGLWPLAFPNLTQTVLYTGWNNQEQDGLVKLVTMVTLQWLT